MLLLPTLHVGFHSYIKAGTVRLPYLSEHDSMSGQDKDVDLHSHASETSLIGWRTRQENYGLDDSHLR
jgi:hypothetical protein